MSYPREHTIKEKAMHLPIYFPDATRAVIRSLDSQDLEKVHVEGLVTNTYHLLTQPGPTVVEQLGGIHSFMSWDGWVTTDSGGFQILSMIQRNPGLGRVTDGGVRFSMDSRGGKKRINFTPEKSIQAQFKLGSDIMICLDDFTPPGANRDQARQSIERTINWAKRCKREYEHQVALRGFSNSERPILLGVIQGGDFKDLRAECADRLRAIGFDGYGYGGWPLDGEGNFDDEMMGFVAELMPEGQPKFALGVGNPQNIVEGFKLGYTIFDCVLPTRDGRHGRLYNFSMDPETAELLDVAKVYRHLYILREKYVRDNRPISGNCDCSTCRHYSRAYLHHLFRIQDATAGRLATIHNLRMYTRLIEALRKYVE